MALTAALLGLATRLVCAPENFLCDRSLMGPPDAMRDPEPKAAARKRRAAGTSRLRPGEQVRGPSRVRLARGLQAPETTFPGARRHPARRAGPRVSRWSHSQLLETPPSPIRVAAIWVDPRWARGRPGLARFWQNSAHYAHPPKGASTSGRSKSGATPGARALQYRGGDAAGSGLAMC